MQCKVIESTLKNQKYTYACYTTNMKNKINFFKKIKLRLVSDQRLKLYSLKST